MSEVNDAVGRVAQDECETLVSMLQGEGRKAYVFAAWVENGEVTFTGAISRGTRVVDVSGFAQALEHEHKRFAAALPDDADG